MSSLTKMIDLTPAAFFLSQFQHMKISGEVSPTFGHANANFSVFIDRIRNQFLKK